jgi:hypothetical protein
MTHKLSLSWLENFFEEGLEREDPYKFFVLKHAPWRKIKLINNGNRKLTKTQQLKSALMSDLLTGSVRVKNNENEKVEAM